MSIIPALVSIRDMATHMFNMSSPSIRPDSSTPNIGVRKLNIAILLALLRFSSIVHSEKATADSMLRYARSSMPSSVIMLRCPPSKMPTITNSNPPRPSCVPVRVAGLYTAP